jgi:hypothetical protein
MPSVIEDGRQGDGREQDEDKVGEGHRRAERRWIRVRLRLGRSSRVLITVLWRKRTWLGGCRVLRTATHNLRYAQGQAAPGRDAGGRLDESVLCVP